MFSNALDANRLTNLTSISFENFNTSNVTDMSCMFCCDSLTSLNLSNFNTSKVETMVDMFTGCKNLKTLDLSSFDTKSVKYMDSAFKNARISELIIGTFDLINSYSVFNKLSDIFEGAEIDKLHIKNYIGYEDIREILINAGISKEVIIDSITIQSLPQKTRFSWDNLD